MSPEAQRDMLMYGYSLELNGVRIDPQHYRFMVVPGGAQYLVYEKGLPPVSPPPVVEHQCPICGGTDLKITVEKDILVSFEGEDHEVLDSDLPGDLVWDDTSHAECNDCGHEAPLGEMK